MGTRFINMRNVLVIGITLAVASAPAISNEDMYVESAEVVQSTRTVDIQVIETTTNYDCRTDKTWAPISIEFDNDSGNEVRVRGCQNQYACKPFQDCVVGMAAGAKAVVTLDASFKYFVMTYHGDARDTELYPDANLKYPAVYEIKAPTTAVVEVEQAAASYDCRTDKTSTPISIEFDNDSGNEVRVRGCQNQYACKPFQDCVVGMV